MSNMARTSRIAGAGLLLTLAAVPTAFAQEAGEAAPPTQEPLAEKVDRVEGKLEAMQEPFTALQGDVKKLKGLKLSGYVQARFEMKDVSRDGVKDDGKTVANEDMFHIRRSRLKVTYTGTEWSEVMLQIDATGKGLSLKDAEVSLIEPWSPAKLRLTAGQTKIPFGFEIAQSSSEREMPERSLVIRKLFPGERDRGVKLGASWKFLRLNLGLLNGNGIEDTGISTKAAVDSDDDGVADSSKTLATINFGNNDRDSKKDFAGRLGVDFGVVSAGVSGYAGQWGVIPTLIDEDGDGAYDNSNDLEYLAKTRLGADVQLYLDLIPGLGGTALRGEFIQGHGIFEKAEELDVDARGWYATLVQTLGTKFAIAARVDQFDPDLATEDDETLAIEPALLFYPTSAIKLTTAYQVVRDHAGDEGADKENNVLTLQLQGKF